MVAISRTHFSPGVFRWVLCMRKLYQAWRWSSVETQELSGLSPLSNRVSLYRTGLPPLHLSLSPKDGKLCKRKEEQWLQPDIYFLFLCVLRWTVFSLLYAKSFFFFCMLQRIFAFSFLVRFFFRSLSIPLNIDVQLVFVSDCVAFFFFFVSRMQDNDDQKQELRHVKTKLKIQFWANIFIQVVPNVFSLRCAS